MSCLSFRHIALLLALLMGFLPLRSAIALSGSDHNAHPSTHHEQTASSLVIEKVVSMNCEQHELEHSCTSGHCSCSSYILSFSHQQNNHFNFSGLLPIQTQNYTRQHPSSFFRPPRA